MRLLFFCVFMYFYIFQAECMLWNKGVVHYAINKKDYDIHSQDIIISTLERVERELCVKFFNTPFNYSATTNEKILYISNPDKRKNCPPEPYNYNGTVVDMAIGYKCLNERDIVRIIVDMLRASIEGPIKPNSNDLLRRFQEQNDDTESPALLSASDRNFINAHYHEECAGLEHKPVEVLRTFASATLEMSEENEKYYSNKLWPFGVVMYGVAPLTSSFLSRDELLAKLQQAMTVIELSTCVVFQHVSSKDPLDPKNLLWFGAMGEELPNLGFTEGNQSVRLDNMVNGAPGHTAHTLNLLMRILGIPMMSNRYDRDNYIKINWKNVINTKEVYLERVTMEAWLRNLEGEGAAYDYDSVTHAPVNYMCADCSLGEQTVSPVQDHLWQRALTMGHRSDLSKADIEMLNLLYKKECEKRIAGEA